MVNELSPAAERLVCRALAGEGRAMEILDDTAVGPLEAIYVAAIMLGVGPWYRAHKGIVQNPEYCPPTTLAEAVAIARSASLAVGEPVQWPSPGELLLAALAVELGPLHCARVWEAAVRRMGADPRYTGWPNPWE